MKKKSKVQTDFRLSCLERRRGRQWDGYSPWYVIGGLWTETGWKVYINGTKHAEFHHPVSSQFQYIVLSLEVSKWAGEIPKNQFRDSVEFDYIRVYQNDEQFDEALKFLLEILKLAILLKLEFIKRFFQGSLSP